MAPVNLLQFFYWG